MKKTSVFQSLSDGITRSAITLRVVAGLAVGSCCANLQAQTTLKTIEIVQPGNGETLQADFILPQADKVSSFEVSAGGTALEKDKVQFTATDKVTDYHCAILLVVDKTLGNGKDVNDKVKERLRKAVRDTMGKFSEVAGTGAYQVGVVTISDGNMEVMSSILPKKTIIDSAIEKLNFNGTSPELYAGTKRAVEWLASAPANRKFLVLFSDGTSNDKVTTPQDVIQAATKAKVHICTIGFPKSVEAQNDVQKLGPIAEETGGYPIRADGGTSKLATDAESNLLKFFVSGGKAEVKLAGLKAPVNLDFKVQTEFGKAYTFAYNVAAIEAPAPVATPTPNPESVQPQATPSSKVSQLKSKLQGHPALAIGSGVALLVALFFVGALVVNLVKKPTPDDSENAVTEPLLEPFPPGSEEDDDEDTQVPGLAVAAPELVPEPAPAMAWLVSLDADATRYPITKIAVRIGRKPDNDIVMKNDSVSSHHAELLKRGDKFVITDLESSNKIMVAGKLVDKATLENGDIIELGEVRLRFLLNQSNESIS